MFWGPLKYADQLLPALFEVNVPRLVRRLFFHRSSSDSSPIPFSSAHIIALLLLLCTDIPWPTGCSNQTSPTPSDTSEALSPEAVELITSLLSRSPVDRLAAASHLRTNRFLAPVGDWTRLNELEMPFVPYPEDSTDTSYFQIRNEVNKFEIFHSGADLSSHR
ncbi:unnamed protein product [Dicrocoelium dendriticum]|nr:unnamed protein product [Dicrocoelium dendriticum]